MDSRLYEVLANEDGPEDVAYLIEATSNAQAMRFVAKLK